MRNTQIKRFIDQTREELKPARFPIDGFDFEIDTLDGECHFSEEACRELGFYHPKQPKVAGFTYVCDSYKAYVESQADEQC